MRVIGLDDWRQSNRFMGLRPWAWRVPSCGRVQPHVHWNTMHATGMSSYYIHCLPPLHRASLYMARLYVHVAVQSLQ